MVRIPLVINEQRLKTLEELRENFNLVQLIARFHGGQLRAWLHCWEFEAEQEQLEALPPDLPDSELAEALCRIFRIEGEAKEQAFHHLKTWQEMQQAKQKLDQLIKMIDQYNEKWKPYERWFNGGEPPSEEERREYETAVQTVVR